jgi:hypothetical protein
LLVPKIAVTIFFTHKPFFLHSKTPQVIALFSHFAKTPEKICRPLLVLQICFRPFHLNGQIQYDVFCPFSDEKGLTPLYAVKS